MSELPPFPRGKIKIRRVHPSADGTIEHAPSAVADGWWQAVLDDPRASRKPLDFDTLGFNRDDTADISCDECKMKQAVTMEHLLTMGFKEDKRVSDAISEFIHCGRSAKRCRLGYRLRIRRR